MRLDEVYARLKYRYDYSKSPLKVWHIKNEIVFIHIPKCAGISVHQAVYGEGFSAHRYYNEYKKDEKKKKLSLSYFTTLRDPIERFVSARNYLLRGGRVAIDKYHSRLISGLSIAEIIQRLNDKRLKDIPHFIPQSEYAPYANDINYFHIEDMERLEWWLSSKLARNVSIGRLNQARVRGNMSLSDSEMDIIKHFYRKDYELLEKVLG